MTLYECLRSGRRYRRGKTFRNEWYEPKKFYPFTYEAQLADDWEIEEKRIYFKFKFFGKYFLLCSDFPILDHIS